MVCNDILSEPIGVDVIVPGSLTESVNPDSENERSMMPVRIIVMVALLRFC